MLFILFVMYASLAYALQPIVLEPTKSDNLQFDSFLNDNPSDDIRTDAAYWGNEHLWDKPNHYEETIYANDWGKKGYSPWGRNFNHWGKGLKAGWRRGCRTWCGFIGGYLG